MFKGIPVQRLACYLILIGFSPVIAIVFYFYTEQYELSELRLAIESVEQQFVIKEQKQALNGAVLRHFRDADHFYIDKHLETVVLLEPEIEALQKIMEDKNFADDERVKKRLEFLTSPNNSLVFSEGIVQKFPQFQETVETLVHPVEVNSTDVQNILARIEGIEIDPFKPGPLRPQLMITEFKLEKKKINEKNDVFTLYLKLIKREFL